ncbi:TolC family protein [Taibaiella soli]|uniref:TolC family protein n=1 Tax=Taibaiella soli TaxID=1649169 RepID=A0A2W2C391_9BACT|nr:TolC family protein [Taibaiella soli]PZF74573.1 TolC family protein [Taibaiella soli]
MMQNGWLKYGISATLLWAATIAGAQDATDTLPSVWNLNDCIEYANTHNYNINTQRYSKESSQQNLLLSKSALLPNLYGNGSFSVNHTGAGIANPSQESSTSTTGTASVNTAWTLFNGGYLRKDIQQKEIAVQTAGLSIDENINNVELQVTQAYLYILLDKETIIYNEDLIKTSQAQLEQMQQQFAVGSAAKKDVIQLEAQLAQDKYNLVTSKSTERIDKLTLKKLLLLPSEVDFDIVKPDTIFSLELLPPLQDVQATALDFRPEVKISELSLKSQELSLAKAKAGYLPTLSLSGGIGTNIGNTTSYSLGFSLDNSFYQQAGVNLSVPIFTRRVNKTNVALARIGIKQAELDLQNTKVTLSQTVEQAYINAVNTQNQYVSAKEQLVYNTEAFRISSEELKIGSLNMVGYIQQRNLYVQSLQQFVQAKYNAAMSLKIYKFYKGEPFTLN